MGYPTRTQPVPVVMHCTAQLVSEGVQFTLDVVNLQVNIQPREQANNAVKQRTQAYRFSVKLTQDGHRGRIITEQGHIVLAQRRRKAL